MKTKDRSKKLFSVIMICLIIMSLCALPVSAAVDGKISGSEVWFDTPHGHRFRTGSAYLNQYGNATVSGTHVGTWSNTGDNTQAWDPANISNGTGWVIRCNPTFDLALNIYRSGTQPEVNVIRWDGNDYNDCVLGQGTLTLQHAKSPYQNFGVTKMSTRTAAYDANGYICRWTGSPTSWIHIVD